MAPRSLSSSAPPDRIAYLLLALLCLGIRLVYVSGTGMDQLYTRWSTATDAVVYDQFGWNLASRGTLGVGDRPSGFAMPGYPMLLAAVYHVFGHLPGAARYLQAFLGLLTVLAIGRTAGILAGRRAELIAVAAGAVYPFFVYFTGEILSECLFMAALSGMLLTAAQAGRDGRTSSGILHGACLTVAALTRPVGVFLEPAVLVLARPWSRTQRRPRIAGLLLGFLLCGTTWGGWIARNRSVFGETIPFDTHGGFALYLGHLEAIGASQQEIHEKLGYTHDSVAQGRIPGGPRGELETDRRSAAKAWESIRQDPRRFALSVLRNVAALWFRLNYSDVAAGTGRLTLATLAGWASYCPILGIACAGLWRLLRERRWRVLAAFLGIFLITSAVHGVVIGGQRYRVATIDPLLLVLAPLGADGWIEARRKAVPSPPSEAGP